MFEDFSKRKCEEYLKQVKLTDDKIYFKNIKQSNLPPFIVNFFNCSLKHKKIPLRKEEFEKILQNAVIFNINYVIKPKATLLKFLFGNTDARPTDYITERLCYFQFYRYYADSIIEFIQLHSPPVMSITQVEKLMDEINKKIFDEINDEESSDTQRLNLVKLLYHFFIDLTENNPINIKLPKSVLSAFFQDKQFEGIKKRVDSFFKEDIFIQEAVELIKKKPKKEEKEKPDAKTELKAVNETSSILKPDFLDSEVTAKEIEKTKSAEETEIHPILEEGITKTENRTHITDSDIYSEELLVISSNPERPWDENKSAGDWLTTQLIEKEKILDKLFCEVNYTKKIIKNLFHRNENLFREFVFKLFDINNWETAVEFIDSYFTKNKIDYYSEEAVKFIDIMQSYFGEENEHSKSGMNGG